MLKFQLTFLRNAFWMLGKGGSWKNFSLDDGVSKKLCQRQKLEVVTRILVVCAQLYVEGEGRSLK